VNLSFEKSIPTVNFFSPKVNSPNSSFDLSKSSVNHEYNIKSFEKFIENSCGNIKG